MLRPSPSSLACLAAVVFLPPLLCGCTPFGEYIQNGFKVGPNYHQPPAPVAPEWIDAADERVRQEADDPSKWWTVFNDPVLDDLVCRAYRQNLTLREAAFRVLQARAQLAIARGNLFAQSQTMTGDFRQIALSLETANSVIPTPAGPVPLNQFFPQWDYGFNLGWELDFWGRIRRAIESDSATLDASAADYDDVLVTLLGDVATNYVQLRTIQQRIKVARDNAAIQRDTLRIAEQRFKAGTVDASVPHQARSTLKQTEAEIPELEIGLRQTSNRLCVLLGMPPAALQAKLDSAPIPTAPPEAVVGIPADLLRRRPDVRRAERLAAAQSARIGVAEAEFYPHIAITGTLGYSAKHFPNLFRSQALNGEIGPSFQWNILNYGRIRNGVRYEDARFQELVAAYQQTVLRANEDVEDGLATFLKAQERTTLQAESVDAAAKAVEIVHKQFKEGLVNYTPVFQVEQNLVQQQDTLAQARGEIATGLIHVYRALGGGWQLRCTGCETGGAKLEGAAPAEETAPLPRPEPAPFPKEGKAPGS